MNAKKIEKSEKPEKIIDSIRLYQAIVFEKKSVSYFLTRKIKGKVAVEVSLEPLGVEIKSDLDHVLVPYANVSCVYYRSKIKEDLIKQGEDAIAKNVGVRSSEISRPK